MKNKKYKYLDPWIMRMPGVKHFLEKQRGKKDVRENQLCQVNDGYTTPIVVSKIDSYNNKINQIYLKTIKEIQPIIEEASSMVVELNIMLSKNFSAPKGKDEEAQRQAARLAFSFNKCQNRKEEILKRLAEIKAELDMVDEMLVHYIERGEALLHSRIEKYWRGVLSVCDNSLNCTPSIQCTELVGKIAYIENRKKLMEIIEYAILKGGGVDNEKEK